MVILNLIVIQHEISRGRCKLKVPEGSALAA